MCCSCEDRRARRRLPAARAAPGGPQAAPAAQVMDLKLKVDGAECERDFYFDKLRDIEILCQTPGLSDIPVRPGDARAGRQGRCARHPGGARMSALQQQRNGVAEQRPMAPTTAP